MVRCDKCKHEFEIKTHDIKTRVQGELHIQYFKCKECNNIYIILVTDKKLRKMIARGLGRSREANDYIKSANLKSKVNMELLKH